MSKIKVEIFFVEEKEVHTVSDSVGVCWNLDDDGKREGDPYVSFVQIRERDGEIYEDEDSPVEGGMDFDWAKTILGELQLALEYATQELGIKVKNFMEPRL